MRKITDLNGVWDFCPVYDVACSLEIPENINYQQITVPSIWTEQGMKYKDFSPFEIMEYPPEWSKAGTAVYKRNFTCLKNAQEKIFLNIENVAQMAAIYINGNFICKWDEMFLSLRQDITEIINNGENELMVVCTGFETTKTLSGQVKTTGLTGSWYGSFARGIWGNVYLETVNELFISDVFVKTSVRKHTIEFVTEISRECTQAEIVIEIKDSGKTVKQLKGKPGAITSEWENPVLWDTENPHLYTAVIYLSQSGNIVDMKEQRFGFREFWNEGTQFILNGTPINLRGDSWHFQGGIQMTKQYALNWYNMCRENGVNYIRLHAEPHPKCYLEAADEVGMLIVDETAIYGSGKSMNAAKEQYIERCKIHCKRLVMRDRNHPCIIFWSLQNEMRWVDGRDEFKRFIPEMIKDMNMLDPTRKVSVDGDNRLISYENTQLESYHYNIDGTIEQWRREKPLTIGEHGGMWYICPQNASAYNGLKAYENFEPCAVGFAKKEKLFFEDARRKGVSGISTFNFAYYFNYSMPDEDVYVENAPFKKIPKYSLSINNGYLKDYPIYLENPFMCYMRECFRPVTVINREYNTSFFDKEELCRSFDVYNDTLHTHSCEVKYKFTVGGIIAKTDSECFIQQPAELHILSLKLPVERVENKTSAVLEIELLHDGKKVFAKFFNYAIYPSAAKTEEINIKKQAFFYGDDKCFKSIKALLPECKRIKNVSEAGENGLLIIGSYITDNPNSLREQLGKFTANGGALVVLEQSDFALGNLSLQKQEFFSAYTGNPSHPLLKGLSDDDFIFWKPYINSERPEAIILQNYLKPDSGEYTFVLESSHGDYADGGDFWSPLMEMKNGKGRAVFCQLEITENFESAPQACTLLRNIIDYAGNADENTYKRVVAIGKKATKFLENTTIKFNIGNNLCGYDVLVADICEINAEDVKTFVEGGGVYVTLPFGQNGADILSKITGCNVLTQETEVSHLTKTADSKFTNGISPVDLYRYDKVPMSPLQVSNGRIAGNSVSADGAEILFENVVGTPWDDYYWNQNCSEFCRIPLVSMNRENVSQPLAFLSQKSVGKGTILLSQLSAKGENKKDVRIYTRLLADIGAETVTELFNYDKSDFDYAVDSFMTLPVNDWQDYIAAKEYYTNPQFSLNNLGEGLYGWMLKVEKNRANGYITVPDSSNKKYFLTCFADYYGEDSEVNINLSSNAETHLYVNGDLQKTEKVRLIKGTNRIIIEADNKSDDNLKFIVIILDKNNNPVSNLRTHLTIDEVDPE